MDARPHGIGLAIAIAFALAMTGAAFLFLGFAAWVIFAAISGDTEVEPGENAPLSLVVILIGLPTFIGSAFAMVAATLWRAIIGPRGHSHA